MINHEIDRAQTSQDQNITTGEMLPDGANGQPTQGQQAAKATHAAAIYNVAKATETAENLTVASSLSGHSLRALLRDRNFVPLWIGQLVSYMGDQFMLIAALAVVSQIAGNNSGIVTAGLGLSNAIPSILLGLVGGVLVDRLDRKTVMIVADIVRGLALFSLLFVNNDPTRLWIFFVVLAITGAASTLFYPARASTLPTIVSRDMLAGANALLESGFVIALVVGALTAGILVERFGANLAFGFNGLAYLFSASMIVLIRIPKHTEPPVVIDGSLRKIWQELTEGLQYIWSTPAMRYIMVMSIMISASIGAVLLLSLEYLTKELHVGPSQYGMVIATLGVGIVIGGILIKQLSNNLPTNRLVAAAIALNGLAILGFVLHPLFGVVCIFTALIGFSIVVARAVLGTLTQAIPPEDLRGRVQAAFNLMSSVPLAISVGIVGLLLQLVTVHSAFEVATTWLPMLTAHSASRHWIIFTGFAIAMLLTAWLAVNILKGIDQALYSGSGTQTAQGV